MNRFYAGICSLILLSIIFTIPSSVQAQGNNIRKSLKASVTQRLGTDTDITIDFSRPGIKGRKIWGELVPYGLAPGNKASNGKPFPWRAGANENTTIEFNKDLINFSKRLCIAFRLNRGRFIGQRGNDFQIFCKLTRQLQI